MRRDRRDRHHRGALTGDQAGYTDAATLTVTVNGVNDAPVAGDFTFNGANAAIGNTALRSDMQARRQIRRVNASR